MTVCRFFQQGYCRYGNSCRFEHTYAQNYSNQGTQNNQYQVVNQPQNNVTTEQMINQVSADTSSALNGRQWRLSSYGPFKCKPNFPGLIDISPEELRHQMYEARINGSMTQLETHLSKIISESTEKLKALSKPTGPLINTIISLYKNEVPEDPFMANSFNVSQNTNVFGGSTISAAAPPNVFGNQMQNNTAPNVFGNQTQNNPPSNIFGNQVQNNTVPNVFGNQTQNNPTNNIFGNATNNSSNMASSLFAEAAQNIFQAPATNAFGATNFGEQPKSVETMQNNNINMFNQTQPPVIQQNVFGTTVQNSNNVFGAVQTAIQPSLFAPTNNTVAQPATVPDNVFGQISVNTHSPFNSQPTNVFQTQPSNNIFAVNNSSLNSGNPFGNQTKVEIRPEIYSKLEELSEHDLAAFKNDSFLPGQIPEVPPPMELC